MFYYDAKLENCDCLVATKGILGFSSFIAALSSLVWELFFSFLSPAYTNADITHDIEDLQFRGFAFTRNTILEFVLDQR